MTRSRVGVRKQSMSDEPMHAKSLGGAWPGMPCGRACRAHGDDCPHHTAQRCSICGLWRDAGCERSIHSTLASLGSHGGQELCHMQEWSCPRDRCCTASGVRHWSFALFAVRGILGPHPRQ